MQGASCAFQCWKAWLFHALNILLLRRTNSMEMNVLSPEEELQKLYWLGQWEGYFPDAIVLAMKIWPLSIRSCLMVVYFHPHWQKWCFLFTLWSMNEVISPILCVSLPPGFQFIWEEEHVKLYTWNFPFFPIFYVYNAQNPGVGVGVGGTVVMI